MTRALLSLVALVASAAAADVVATVDAGGSGRPIPRSFAGLSREWRRFPSPDGGPASAVHPVYIRLIEQLAAFNEGALSFRVGGNSTEGMSTVPDDDRWRQFGAIFKATRTPLIININLARNNPALDQAMIQAAQRLIPPGGILTFELGNEPDGWAGRHKPADYTFEKYLEDYRSVGTQLVPTLTDGLAGPGWAHGAPREILSRFLETHRPLVKLLTVHSYRFNPKKNPQPKQLLEEGATAGFARTLSDGIAFAHEAGLKLRLAETGSAWGGGVPGFSDTFAAALWTSDFMFELANAGLDGVNFHGGGTSNYSAIREDVESPNGRAIITARAPFYGILLFAEAVANNARFIPIKPSAEGRVKLWAMCDAAGTVRVVTINKDLAQPADVTLHLPRNYAQGTLKRLQGPAIEATKGITFAGQTFDNSLDGSPQGARDDETVGSHDGAFRFTVAPASAALLIVPQ
jgi:hypothetical protein